MTNTNTDTDTDTDTNTAIVSVPSNTPPARLDALERYGRAAGSLYGELLKFSGKTGAWASGAQGLEVAIGTHLVAIVLQMLAVFVRWQDGELVEQVMQPIALGLRRAQRGQSSASQLATNPRQRLWCHLARARVPDTANRVPVLDYGSQLKKRKDSDCHPPLPTGGGLPVCTGPSSEIRIGKAERGKREKDQRPNAFFRARRGWHSQSHAQFVSSV